MHWYKGRFGARNDVGGILGRFAPQNSPYTNAQFTVLDYLNCKIEEREIENSSFESKSAANHYFHMIFFSSEKWDFELFDVEISTSTSVEVFTTNIWVQHSIAFSLKYV